MKKNALWWVLGLALVSTAGTPGSTQANGLDNRIHKLAARFEAMQQKPDKRVPADPLQRARGIILLGDSFSKSMRMGFSVHTPWLRPPQCDIELMAQK